MKNHAADLAARFNRRVATSFIGRFFRLEGSRHVCFIPVRQRSFANLLLEYGDRRDDVLERSSCWGDDVCCYDVYHCC